MPADGDTRQAGSAGYRRALRLRSAGELIEGIAAAAAETETIEPFAVHLRLRMFYELQDFGALQAEARRIVGALTTEGVAQLTSDDIGTLLQFAEAGSLEDDTMASLLALTGPRARRESEIGVAWRAAHYRLRYRRGLASRYAGSASIVSLGLNCLPFTLPGFWGFRREADYARLFVPFSLGGHTVDAVSKPIAEDFGAYCTPDTIRIIKTQRGHSLAIRADRTTHWNHNRGPYWLADGASRLIANMAAKAQAFREACRRPDAVFLMATCPVDYPAEKLDFLPGLQAALARHTGTDQNHILITNQTNRGATPGFRRVSDTVAFVNCPYPTKEYVWHDDAMANTKDGIEFERTYVSLLLRTLLGWGSTGGKTPPDMPRPNAILPPDLLDRTILRHWRKGERQDLTGRAFWGQVTRLAGWVETRTQPGDFVLVIGHTAPDMMAMFLAVAASGRLGAYFPPHSPIQDERHYYEQQRHALAAINPAAICAMEPQAAATVRRIDPDLGARVLDVPSGAPDREPRALDAFRARLDSDAPLFVQHSSGTTGIKKAVAISGRMLTGQFESYWPIIRAEANADRLSVATWLPLYHDMGLVASFLLPVLGGDTISTLDPFEWISDPGAFFAMIEADRCDTAWMPNFAFRHFLRLQRTLKPRRLDGVKLWVNCSEPCRWPDARGFEASFAEWGVRPRSVVGCYAMAETVFAVSQCTPADRRALSVPPAIPPGTPIAETGAMVLTDAEPGTPPAGHKAVLSSGRVLPGLDVATYHEGRRLPDGTYGEIGIAGDFLFPGYRGRNAAESNIEAGIFRTGDLGAIVDGHVFVFGRLKEIIIVNGKNIFAGDVEASLGAIHGLRKGRIVAFGVDSDMTGSEELIVVAEHDANAGVADTALRSAVSREVTKTFLVKPRDVRIVADRWLVKSTSGKISRDENRRRYLEQFRAGGGP